jgi:hypothetical protein
MKTAVIYKLNAVMLTFLLLLSTDVFSSPQNISINYADSTVTLGWDVLTGADKYYIYGGSEPKNLTLIDSTVTNSWNTAFPNSRYFFQVSGFAIEEPVEVLVRTRLDGTSIYGKYANVKVTTLNPDTTPESQTKPLDSEGMAYYQFTYNPLSGKVLLPLEIQIIGTDSCNFQEDVKDTTYVWTSQFTELPYNLKKIEQAKRIKGTIRDLENLVGIENAKVVVAKMQEDGSFKHVDSTFTDALGEYMTGRIAVDLDSMYVKIYADGFMNTVVAGQDKEAFISKIPMTARANRADTLQTGKYFQIDIDYILIPDLETHPLYYSAIQEQNNLGNPITSLTNDMLVQGRIRGNLSNQAWGRGERLGLYLVPGEFNEAERDSMVLWLDEEARATGYDGGFNEKFELLTIEPTETTASYLRIRKGDNVFSGWEYNNSSSVADGYYYDIIIRGGEVLTYLQDWNKNAMLKELTSRPTQDNVTLYVGNSNASASYLTDADKIFRGINLKWDRSVFEHGYNNGSKRELVSITMPQTKAEATR